MTLKITFELSADDLKHFQLIMTEARTASAGYSEERIIRDANTLLDEVRATKVPEFIQQRLHNLESLIGMITDQEWRLPADEKARVLNALAYFSEPEDLIPDHVPGLGFLDDAIMIELVARELKHELDAYTDFCDYRDQKQEQSGSEAKPGVTREDWLKAKRQELQSRMRKRRKPLSLF